MEPDGEEKPTPLVCVYLAHSFGVPPKDINALRLPYRFEKTDEPADADLLLIHFSDLPVLGTRRILLSSDEHETHLFSEPEFEKWGLKKNDNSHMRNKGKKAAFFIVNYNPGNGTFDNRLFGFQSYGEVWPTTTSSFDEEFLLDKYSQMLEQCGAPRRDLRTLPSGEHSMGKETHLSTVLELKPYTHIQINVGGRLFDSTVGTLCKSSYLEEMLLSRERGEEDVSVTSTQHLFVDRDPEMFELVLKYIRNRDSVRQAPHGFLKELELFRLKEEKRPGGSGGSPKVVEEDHFKLVARLSKQLEVLQGQGENMCTLH